MPRPVAMSSRRQRTAGTKTIRPQYAEAFRCVGPACEDTCCQGWSVFIDKPTYTKYQTIPDGPLRTIVDQRLEQTGNGGDFEHARVRLHDDGRCPFLAEDRLCAIQKEHGEDYLSRTCSQYPRACKTIDGIEEQSLLLSCPEAARLVLLNRRLVPRKKHSQPAGFLDHGASTAALSMPQAYFRPVRNFAVQLLQDRSYPLWQRVFLLNMFCKRIEALAAKRDWNRMPSLLSEHAAMIANGSLRVALNSVPAQATVQLGIVMTLVDDRPSSGWMNRRFVECIEDFASGIGYQPGRTAVDLTQNYADAYDRFYQPWIAKYEFMLENYLLNYVFGHLFPFGPSGPEQGLHPYRESQLLCFLYGLIKGLLVGMAGHYRLSFSSEHVVKLIQSFSKSVEHNAGLLRRIETFFAAHGLNDTNGIAALLCESTPEMPAQPPKVPTQMPVSPL
jgi:lysine-N-methylase